MKKGKIKERKEIGKQTTLTWEKNDFSSADWDEEEKLLSWSSKRTLQSWKRLANPRTVLKEIAWATLFLLECFYNKTEADIMQSIIYYSK